jgi:hypothetical protein
VRWGLNYIIVDLLSNILFVNLFSNLFLLSWQWKSRICNNNIRRLGVMVFNATFNNFSVRSWQSVLMVQEPRENHWQTLSLKCIEFTSDLMGLELTTLVVIGTDCIANCKFNYHTITTAPNTSYRNHINNSMFINEFSRWRQYMYEIL